MISAPPAATSLRDRPGGTRACVVAGAWAALAVAGCATTSPPVEPPPNPLLATPIVPELPPGGPPVADGRARFRQVFCAELQAQPQAAAGRPCENWLWHLPDEPDRPAADFAVRRPAPIVDIVLVPGAFGECYGEEAWPFAEGAKQLVDRGYHVHLLMVSGRSGTEANAKQIAAALASLEFTPGRKIVMIGFSKGSNDILRFLVDFPDLAKRIDAVVSVGSPVLGTPAADLAAGTYDMLLKKLPLAACAPGDGQVIESLRPATRAAWMAAHSLPPAVRYYSLAAFAGRDRIASMLVPSWKYLGEFDKRNDGQVIASMAVIPGATLLGYANADHWGLAMHNERHHPHLVKRMDPVPFPTEALVLALVEFVEQDLNARTAAR